MKYLILLLLSSTASAGQALLTWPAVTLNTDGSTIAGPVTYNVYKGLKGQTKTLLVSGLTAATYTDLNLALGTTDCYEVTANTPGEAEGLHSPEGCKTITQPAGTVITIAQNVYQRKSGTGIVLCGKIALGVTCGADANIKVAGRELYDVPRWRVTFTRRDNGTQTFGVCA